MKTRSALAFPKLPKEYASLCRLHLPRPIRDKADYENTLEVAEAFAGFEELMTADQNDYFEMLTTLLESWEKEHVKWANVAGADLLKHLATENGMTGADLSRLLGASRQLGAMILRGDREITAEHARVLGKHFGLNPGAFIE